MIKLVGMNTNTFPVLVTKYGDLFMAEALGMGIQTSGRNYEKAVEALRQELQREMAFDGPDEEVELPTVYELTEIKVNDLESE